MATIDNNNSCEILVVEDEEDQRKRLQFVLESEKYQVDTAENGDEAVQKIGLKRYDLVITDLKMPGKSDGIDVLRAAREAHEDTEVFIVTAYGTVENAVKAMLSGAFDYIQKPVNMSEFRIKVERAIQFQRTRKSADQAEVRESNSRILMRQIQEFRERLNQIHTISKFLLKEIGPSAPFRDSIEKITDRSDV
jgi:DNA-binding NtrC family response regulator